MLNVWFYEYGVEHAQESIALRFVKKDLPLCLEESLSGLKKQLITSQESDGGESITLAETMQT